MSKTLNPNALNGITDYYNKKMLLNVKSIAKGWNILAKNKIFAYNTIAAN